MNKPRRTRALRASDRNEGEVVTQSEGAHTQVGPPVAPPHPGVHIEALCEPCGTWHSIDLRPTDDQPITLTVPCCWACGHTPLAVVASGRLAAERCQAVAEDKFSRVQCVLRRAHSAPLHEASDGWSWR